MRSKIWMILILISFISGCSSEAIAHQTVIKMKGYSNEEICEAIYKAEGGSKTEFLYGIKSISCSGKKGCQKVCITTIKHDRERFKEFQNKGDLDLIEYIARSYCPLSDGIDRRGLNKNWIKNVKYFLAKENKK